LHKAAVALAVQCVGGAAWASACGFVARARLWRVEERAVAGAGGELGARENRGCNCRAVQPHSMDDFDVKGLLCRPLSPAAARSTPPLLPTHLARPRRALPAAPTNPSPASLFGVLTIPDIAREGADFVNRLKSDNVWVRAGTGSRRGTGGARARPELAGARRGRSTQPGFPHEPCRRGPGSPPALPWRRQACLIHH
jgi:hypothetical protein